MDPHHLRRSLEGRGIPEPMPAGGELHRHLLRDAGIELQFVGGHHHAKPRGVAGLTLFGSRGRYREATLDRGDVGYIPQGYGHSLENVGQDPARILIVFNAGTYETVDLSQFLAGQPADVLAVNFGKPAATFDAFPKRDVFITGG